jgi:hypothetical protein
MDSDDGDSIEFIAGPPAILPQPAPQLWWYYTPQVHRSMKRSDYLALLENYGDHSQQLRRCIAYHGRMEHAAIDAVCLQFDAWLSAHRAIIDGDIPTLEQFKREVTEKMYRIEWKDERGPR